MRVGEALVPLTLHCFFSRQRYRRFTAYKLVLKKHPFKQRPNYEAALNDNYSMHALRHEVRRMLRDIDPETVRRRRAESLVQKSRDK